MKTDVDDGNVWPCSFQSICNFIERASLPPSFAPKQCHGWDTSCPRILGFQVLEDGTANVLQPMVRSGEGRIVLLRYNNIKRVHRCVKYSAIMIEL
jgi:hypothetical protein